MFLHHIFWFGYNSVEYYELFLKAACSTDSDPLSWNTDQKGFTVCLDNGERFYTADQDSVSVAILSSAWLPNWDKTVYQTRQSTRSLFVWRNRTQIWDGLTCWQSRSLGGPGGYLSAERTPDTKTQSCLTPAFLTSIAPVHQNRLEWSSVDAHLLITHYLFFWWLQPV